MIASDPPTVPLPATSSDPGPGHILSDYLFDLPPERIAQAPLEDRTSARLLVIDRSRDTLEHHRIASLVELLRGDELLVLNDTRVVPARLRGRKASGGRFELLALEPLGSRAFVAIGKSSKGFTPGAPLHLDRGPGLVVKVEAALADGAMRVALPPDLDLWQLLELAGETPLPPYVARPEGPSQADRDRYQTVYAQHPGAVAAPTAGLHFTPELLRGVHNKGCEVTSVTLHVGPGTFTPVRVERLDEHRMHRERYTVPPEAAAAIAAARAAGRPVLAVGTTVVRTLEAVARDHDGAVPAGSGDTDIFIRPGFRFRVVDQLMTNFHLPGSTLLMLVAAFAGRERVLGAYQTAIRAGYRFYSYGDGMLLR